ncbi:hypothetical protein KUCAC02_033362 [Chaenocephalus aceratus]|nr:hypothetical protein KUCAC02_033362 [Chaenocephalus aceratus]
MASCSPLLLLVLCTLTVAEAQLKVFDMRASKLHSSFLGIPDAYVKDEEEGDEEERDEEEEEEEGVQEGVQEEGDEEEGVKEQGV